MSPQEFADQRWAGATLRHVDLSGSRWQGVDLGGAVLRDVVLAGASVFGAELDGLTIEGVDVAALVSAELDRRWPARVTLREAKDVAGLRAAWAAIEQAWTPVYARAADLPAGATDEQVDGEWSFTQTLRHLVFAAEMWLGCAERVVLPYHPWGLPFTDAAEFVPDLGDYGLEPDARPGYDEVRAVRAERVARVRELLDGLTDERLAETVPGPPWSGEVTVRTCLRVIANEELEHLRFAVRDLDALAAST